MSLSSMVAGAVASSSRAGGGGLFSARSRREGGGFDNKAATVAMSARSSPNLLMAGVVEDEYPNLPMTFTALGPVGND